MTPLQGGDLRAALNDDPHGEMRWYERGKSIALDIARGLHFLHSHDVSVALGLTGQNGFHLVLRRGSVCMQAWVCAVASSFDAPSAPFQHCSDLCAFYVLTVIRMLHPVVYRR